MTEDKMRPPTAFVVDTNAFGRKIGSGQLEALRELVLRGVDVHVPDVVCLELASHDWESAKNVVARLRNLNLLAGQDITSTTINERMVAMINGTGASVRKTPISYYQKAVHAQVLHVAPATPKIHPGKANVRVTTGAVDHIIYQHALDLADTHRHVCVITGDAELSRTLSAHSAISTAPSIDDAKKLATYSRPSPIDALDIANHVTDFEFGEELLKALKQAGYSRASVRGVGEILRIDHDELLVDVFVDTTDSYDRDELERILVTLAGEEMVITDWTIKFSEPFARWHAGGIASIEEYISTELGMLPTELRPVPVIDGEPVPSRPFYLEQDGRFAFYLGHTELVRVDWSPRTILRSSYFEGQEYPWEDSFVEVELFEGSRKLASQDKGALAAALLRQFSKNRNLLETES